MSAWLEALPPGADLGLLALAAVLAGIINAIAGGGSLLVIPLLIGVGLPPTVANGTLRIAVIVQAILASITFERRGVHEIRPALSLLPTVVGGAALGTYVATQIGDASMRWVFAILLVVWAVVLLVRPERFLATEVEPRRPTLLVQLVAIAVGFYGGFAQAGVGFPLLALAVLGLGKTTVQGNAVKSVIVIAYTAVALGLFIAADDVAWREGAALAVGGALGGWLGARWQLRSGVALIRWMLVATLVVSAAAMLIPR